MDREHTTNMAIEDILYPCKAVMILPNLQLSLIY